MDRISNYGSYLQNMNNIDVQKEKLVQIGEQISSGVKSYDLSDYNLIDSDILVMSNNAIKRLEGYNQSIDIVENYTNNYENILSDFIELIDEVYLAFNSDYSYKSEDSGKLLDSINYALSNVTAKLNYQSNGIYLFAGSKKNLSPVLNNIGQEDNDKQINNSNVNPYTQNIATTVTSLPIKNNPENPSYHTEGDNDSWKEALVYVGNDDIVQYGITANDPAFQELINGLQLIQAAVIQAENQTDEKLKQETYTNYLRAGLDELNISRKNIERLQVSNVMSMSSLENMKKQNQENIDNFGLNISEIASTDDTQTVTYFSFLQSQLEASYQITAQIESMSLLNYL